MNILKHKAYIKSDNIISSLGFDTDENMNHLIKGESGISYCEDPELSVTPFYTSLINSKELIERFSSYSVGNEFTRLEKMLILSVSEALKNTDIDITDAGTLLIISTTKGNIDLLGQMHLHDKNRIYLWRTAQIVADFFHNPNHALVISNACISGLLSVLVAKRLVEAGVYNNAVVAGADMVTHFVVSGFQSFKAVSSLPCKPYDVSRDGITLGEAAGTIILGNTANISDQYPVYVSGGASSNDANHISGPSRTGDGLFLAIKNALHESGLKASDIGHISAHGTATVYNDEMESKAFGLAGMQQVPVISLKGYWGHTLGAAGIIESIAGIRSLKENYLLKTHGFSTPGVPVDICVTHGFRYRQQSSFLKTASGFGGCNAAVIFEKA